MTARLTRRGRAVALAGVVLATLACAALFACAMWMLAPGGVR